MPVTGSAVQCWMVMTEIVSNEALSAKEEMPDTSIMEITDEQLNLYEAMDHLSQLERNMIRDHYFEGWSFIRIARKKQMNYYSVLSFHSSAIDKLKNRLV